MRAAWYEQRGDPRRVLVVGDMPVPVPGQGEVRIALTVSGINPGDVKKRSGWQGSAMPYPRVVPHSDGAGRVDAVGPGVAAARVGEHVWCYGAQSSRPFGTAAEYVVVPDHLAVRLGDPGVGGPRGRDLDEQASCLGIAGITAHRAVFGDGPVRGKTVLIYGAAGGVGSIALQLARRDGATVLAAVRTETDLATVRALGAHQALLDGDADFVARVRQRAPGGVDRITEVDFAAHVERNVELLATGGVVASYATSDERPAVSYWPYGFKDSTVHFLGSDDFPAAVKSEAAATLGRALVEGSLRSRVAARFPLEEVAAAHEMVERGAPGRVLLSISPPAPEAER